MSTPRRTDDGPSFGHSLLRNLAGAVGLVLGSAAVFGGIGMIGRADTPAVVVVDEAPTTGNDAQDDGEPDAEQQVEDDADAASQSGDGSPSEDDPAVGEGDGDAGDDESASPQDPDVDESADPPADADDEPTEPEEAEQAEEADDEADEEADDESEEAARIDPSSVDLQVLDGYQADGGAAAAQVADELRAAGYRVIAENPALRYDVTTVLWSPGGEAQARQVAADIGAAEVREQPGTLSNSVGVHVVVGSDRG